MNQVSKKEFVRNKIHSIANLEVDEVVIVYRKDRQFGVEKVTDDLRTGNLFAMLLDIQLRTDLEKTLRPNPPEPTEQKENKDESENTNITNLFR